MFTHKQAPKTHRHRRPFVHGRREPSPAMLARIVSFMPRMVERICRVWQQEQREHITETTRYGKRVTTRQVVTTVYETSTTYKD